MEMKLLLVAIVLCVFPWSQGHVLRKDRTLRDVIFYETEEECLTPDQVRGRCVAISECPSLFSLTKSKMNRITTDFLRRSTCGFEGKDPKVCCLAADLQTEAPPAFTSPSLFEQKIPVKSTTVKAESATAQPIIGAEEVKSFIDQQYPVASFCGESKALNGRILGGSEAKEGTWPWMALLLYKNQTTGVIYRGCSGVLVGDRQVLTSAYCIEKAEIVKVRLGLHRWGVPGAFKDVLVRKIIPHEFYKKKTGLNDIALVILDEKVQFSDQIQPICLPTDQIFRHEDFVGESPWIAGWGSTIEGGPSSEVLRQVQLPIVSPLSCREAYKDSPNYVIDSTIICAGSPDGGKDFCTIDAGGPLMLSVGSDGSERYHLLGIISSGRGCGRAGFPGIYTRVSEFMPWLQPKMKDAATVRVEPAGSEKKIVARAVACGESEASDQAVKNQITQPGAWPWLVHLTALSYADISTGNQSLQTCIGVLVTDRHVVTAAHCADGTITAKFGLNEIAATNTLTAIFEGAIVANVIKHKSYDKATGEHNIAILVLEDPITFNNALLTSEDFAGQKLISVGWKKTELSTKSVVQHVQLPITDGDTCSSSSSSDESDGTLLCTGSSATDSCQTTSGGPLFTTFGPDKRFHLIGIASDPDGCTKSAPFGRYTRVDNYVKWIDSKIQKSLASRVLLLFTLLFELVFPLPQAPSPFGFSPFRPARQAPITEDQCRTPGGQLGQCLVIGQCPPLLQILKNSSDQRQQVFNYLRQTICGFVGNDPKVCCPAAKVSLGATTTPKSTSTVPKQATTTATTQKPFTAKELLPKECGTNQYTDLRIVGGTESKPGAWPWMAVLLYRNETSKKVSHQCDGVLITDRHVLTAAHCLGGRNQLYRVRLGDHKTNSANDSVIQDARIDHIFTHENYTKAIISNDLALIKLKDKINFTENVRPICLPRDQFFRDSANFVRENAVVAGWGRTTEGGSGSKVLRHVDTVVVSATSCKDSYTSVSNVRITEKVLCAGTVGGGRGFCQGDSGGPLMLAFGPEGWYHLLGIVSHAVGCARANYPGIYVNVPRYMDWIMTKLVL